MRIFRRVGSACDRASGLARHGRLSAALPAPWPLSVACVRVCSLQVTASAATRRRSLAAKKNDGNVTRRGLVEDESIAVPPFPPPTQPAQQRLRSSCSTSA